MENQRYSAPRAGCYAMSQAAVYSTLFRQSQWAKNCNELQALRVGELTHLQQSNSNDRENCMCHKILEFDSADKIRLKILGNNTVQRM